MNPLLVMAMLGVATISSLYIFRRSRRFTPYRDQEDAALDERLEQQRQKLAALREKHEQLRTDAKELIRLRKNESGTEQE